MKKNKWEISIITLRNGKKRYKVTRRIPDLHVAETRVFTSRKKAKEQLEEWLE
jgi:hypothetical protein